MKPAKFRLGAPTALGFAAAMVGALGMAAGGSHAATADPEVAAAAHASRDLRNCDVARASKRVTVERPGRGVRIIEICDGENRGSLSATARGLSAAIDASPPPFRISSDLRTAELVGLRLTRARIEMDPRIEGNARSRKLAEIDGAIRTLDDEISASR